VNDVILNVLRTQDHFLTPGAVSVLIGQGAEGTLGQEPAPEVASALESLRGSEEVAVLPACPVCGRAGEVWTVPERVPAAPAAPVGFTEDEAEEALAPLIEEGAIELGERVELVENECCLRSARPWRRTPRPV
jgi:hypothetical protein